MKERPIFFGDAMVRTSADIRSMRAIQAINVLLSPQDPVALGFLARRVEPKRIGLFNRAAIHTHAPQGCKLSASRWLCKTLNYVTSVFFDGHGDRFSCRRFRTPRRNFNGYLIKPSMQRHAVRPGHRLCIPLVSGTAIGRTAA